MDFRSLPPPPPDLATFALGGFPSPVPPPADDHSPRSASRPRQSSSGQRPRRYSSFQGAGGAGTGTPVIPIERDFGFDSPATLGGATAGMRRRGAGEGARKALGEESRRYEDFTTIDWVADTLLERSRRRHEAATATRTLGSSVRAGFWRIAEACQSWAVVSLVGAIIGLNAALMSIMTAWLSDLKLGYCRQGWWLNRKFCCWEIEEGLCEDWVTWTGWAGVQWLVYVALAGLFAFTCAFLVKSFAPYAAGSGISEIKCILAGFIINGYLSFATLSIKSLTLPISIASGLSVGKEGPSVHVASAIGHVVASRFARFKRSQAKLREIVTAASATGVAVAFGSPIGGVLFSLEEMTINWPIKTMWRSFFCALVANVVLSAMNPFRTGKIVLFQVSFDRDWHFFELGFFILIGVFGGLYGAFVIKYNLQVAAFRRKHLGSSAISEAVTLAVLTAAVAFTNRFLRLDMNEMLDVLFRECEGGGDYENLCQTWAQWRMVNSLLLATVIRTFLVIISYGCKVPAGIFVPSMAVGATFGRMVGILVKAMYRAHPTWSMFAACDPEKPCITPGTYAFLGAAAGLADTTCAQRHYAHHGHGRRHHVRAHGRPHLHPADDDRRHGHQGRQRPVRRRRHRRPDDQVQRVPAPRESRARLRRSSVDRHAPQARLAAVAGHDSRRAATSPRLEQVPGLPRRQEPHGPHAPRRHLATRPQSCHRESSALEHRPARRPLPLLPARRRPGRLSAAQPAVAVRGRRRWRPRSGRVGRRRGGHRRLLVVRQPDASHRLA